MFSQIGKRDRDGDSHGYPLALDDALALLLVDLGLPRAQLVEGVGLGDDAAHEAHGPEAEGLGLEALGGVALADAGGVEDGGHVEGQVAGIAQLAADGGVLEDGVHCAGLGVGGGGGGLEVLDVLADAHQLAGEAELLLDGGPRGDLGGGAIGPVEVPGVEASKVLQDAEDLVTTDGGRDEAQVVSHAGVVDEGVGDHCGGCGDVVYLCSFRLGSKQDEGRRRDGKTARSRDHESRVWESWREMDIVAVETQK